MSHHNFPVSSMPCLPFWIHAFSLLWGLLSIALAQNLGEARVCAGNRPAAKRVRDEDGTPSSPPEKKPRMWTTPQHSPFIANGASPGSSLLQAQQLQSPQPSAQGAESLRNHLTPTKSPTMTTPGLDPMTNPSAAAYRIYSNRNLIAWP